MHKELDSLRASERALRARLRDMELDNDDLEKSERWVPIGACREASNIFMSRQSYFFNARGCREPVQQSSRTDRFTRRGAC